jgi:hypothetical protein
MVSWKTPAVPHTATIASAQEGPSGPITFTPISVELDASVAFACALNRQSEGLDIPPTAISNLSCTDDSAPPYSGDHLECQLLAELWWLAEHAQDTPASTLPTSSPSPTRKAKSRQADPFGQGIHVVGRLAANPAPANQAGMRMRQPREKFRLIETPEDPGSQFADALNRLAEGIDIARAGEPPRPGRRPVFTPIEVAAELESDTAYALNRASEGLAVQSPSSDNFAASETDRRAARVTAAPAAPTIDAASQIEPEQSISPFEHPFAELPPDDHPHRYTTLGHAIRLTCEAAYAWMDVLAGPTRVEMTSR